MHVHIRTYTHTHTESARLTRPFMLVDSSLCSLISHQQCGPVRLSVLLATAKYWAMDQYKLHLIHRQSHNYEDLKSVNVSSECLHSSAFLIS